MTPAEVIAEMQLWKGIKRVLTGAPPIEEWADALERAMRDKDEELDFLRSVKESRGEELDEKDAEIERLREEADQAKALYRETLARAVTAEAEIESQRGRSSVRAWHQIARAWDAGTVRVQDPDTRRQAERFTLDDGTRCTVMDAVADPRNVHGLSRNTLYKRLVDRGWREASRIWLPTVRHGRD